MLASYQSLHGFDMSRVDGQCFFIPSFGFIYVAPQLGYLPPHVQHIVGGWEEVCCLLCASCGLDWFRHADVHLSCENRHKERLQKWRFIGLKVSTTWLISCKKKKQEQEEECSLTECNRKHLLLRWWRRRAMSAEQEGGSEQPLYLPSNWLITLAVSPSWKWPPDERKQPDR